MKNLYLSNIKWIENLFQSKKQKKSDWISTPIAAIAAIDNLPRKEKLRGSNPWLSEPEGFNRALEAYKASKKSLEK